MEIRRLESLAKSNKRSKMRTIEADPFRAIVRSSLVA